jgi:hypothetical protein
MFMAPRIHPLFRALFSTAVLLPAGCDSPHAPVGRVPAHIEAVATDTQTAVVGEVLARAVEVRVLNRHGRPVPAVDVEFEATGGGGSLAPGRVRTDASGIAGALWTLGTVAGVQTSEVRLPGRDLPAVVFSALATAGRPAELVKVGGDRQRGIVGRPLAESLVVRATDAYGNPVPGAQVLWSTRGMGSGHVTPDADTTDAAGLARATWVPGTDPQSVIYAIARIESDSAVFTAAVEGVVVRVRLLVHFSDSTAFRTVLQPTAFPVQALAYGEGNAWVGEVGFSWTSSDTAIALVRADPADHSRATVVVRGEGDFHVSASAQGVVASIEVRAVGVAPGFTAEFTGLHSADALNDSGEVVGWIRETWLRLHAWQGGRLVDMGFGSSGASYSAPAINNRRSILVFAITQSNTGILYGVGSSSLLRGGTVTSLVAQPARAFDIDANDRIVGALQDGGPPFWSRAFVWTNGQITRLDHPTEAANVQVQSYAVAINDHGRVVVNTTGHINESRAVPPVSRAAYLWEAGSYTPIPAPPGCVLWEGVDINDADQVLVRCYGPAAAVGVYLRDGSSFRSLAQLGSAADLNDLGDVVGRRGDETLLWRDGTTFRLLDPAVPTSGALRINNRGQILLNTPEGGYLLTPDR